ncbi:MAG: endonuclease V, partial [Candidatus Lokiarchaeota archaeon]
MTEKDYRELLRDNLDFETAEKLQIKYSHELLQSVDKNEKLTEKQFKVVVGTDVHYFQKEKSEWGTACAVFWDIGTNKVIDSSFAQSEIRFPYKPGFLGFREAKIIVQAIQRSKTKANLLMCDGHGIIHPRFFGEAVHIGLALNLPSLGVAKNPFIGFSNWPSLDRIKGAKTPIWLKDPGKNQSDNKIIGYTICLADLRKPIFLSTGIKISLENALNIALATTKDHRQPQPLYLAHKAAKE